MARRLSFNVITIFVLITILAISQTSAVCCNDPSYRMYNTCNNLPLERVSRYKVKCTRPEAPNEFYSQTEIDWGSVSACLTDLCQTPFCADGTPMDENCGIGGFFCGKTGCTCSDCRINQGTSFEDMEKAWAKKYGMKKICNRDKQTCVDF